MEFYQPKFPVTMQICFTDKMRTLEQVKEWGYRDRWMVIRLAAGGEVLVNADKVNWIEVMQR